MRVLFVTSTRIGDAILSTGLLNHVIATSPQARITVACGPLAVPLFRETPAVERVIEMIKQPRGGHWLSLWFDTVSTSWDHVIDLRGSALAWLLRTRRRTVLGKGTGKEHRLVQLGRAMGLDPPPRPRIWISAQTSAKAKALLPASGPLLALGPTANWPGKQWSADRFADLTKRLLEEPEFADARVAVFGAESERPMAEPLLSRLPSDRTIDLVGKLDLLEVYACLQNATLYIGNDSGLMHLAAAAGTPTIGLFGPSSEVSYAPWGVFTMSVRGTRSFEEVVYAPDFDHLAARNYMEDLSIDRVFDASKALLRRAQVAPGLAAQ